MTLEIYKPHFKKLSSREWSIESVSIGTNGRVFYPAAWPRFSIEPIQNQLKKYGRPFANLIEGRDDSYSIGLTFEDDADEAAFIMQASDILILLGYS